MQLAMSKTREQYPLSPKKIIKKTLSGTIALIIITFLLLIGIGFSLLTISSQNTSNQGVQLSQISNVLTIIGVLVLFLLAVIILIEYLYQRWYFAVYFYDLTADFIQIKKGPITPREITIPYERIQDVYVDQDLLDRFFGLYDVHLSSATISSGMEAHIDGVEKQAAEGLRSILLQTVRERISKNRGTNIPTNVNNQPNL